MAKPQTATVTTPRRYQATDSGLAFRTSGRPRSHPKTDDLLNVAKALLVRVATQSLRHRWSGGQLPADLAPQNAPHGRTLTGSMFELCS